ncbi:helix-turn-helix domain-containing protein [Trinickia acidisoli]|uniref:helix-turn-helix domain-containing protein n=1 Tax=Trinickia acidisoli TaxID=2767482 RepID=UPI001A8EA23D|nr:helix-turn-helix transcriptional regulator [Trinickia acidisoli]
MYFTDQLAALRARRRMSLAAIGGIVGMAVPNLSAVLRGRGDTKASTLASIASALDAEWVLVPKEHLDEVRYAIESKSACAGTGAGAAPDNPAPRTIEIFSGKK